MAASAVMLARLLVLYFMHSHPPAVDEALAWLEEHNNDADIDYPARITKDGTLTTRVFLYIQLLPQGN